MARIDSRSIAGLLFTALALGAAPDALAKKECSNSLKDRSAAQVMAAHRAAIAAQDWQAVGCDYAQDAVVIHDQGVTVGRDAIVNDLQMISGLFAGINPTVHQEVIAPILNDKDMVKLQWSISTQCMDIEDGVDTYIVGNGKIHAQTAHGLPSFRCAP